MNIKYTMKKYTWLIVLIAIILGFSLPQIGLIFRPYLTYLLMLLMFLSCLNIDFQKILKPLKYWKNEMQALAIIHLASPLLILLLKPFFSDEIFLGLIIASVISSGIGVVFLSRLYGGIPSQSLILTSISNILSPITVPFLILIFAKTNIKIDYLAIGLTMLKLVIIPIALALIIRKTKINKHLSDYGDPISTITLFLLITGLIAPVRSIILSNLKLSLTLGGLISILVIINFFLGYLIGSTKPEKITYAISTSYKNFTLSTVIALSLFNPTVALPAVIYTVINNLLLIPLQLIFLKRNSNIQ